MVQNFESGSFLLVKRLASCDMHPYAEVFTFETGSQSSRGPIAFEIRHN